MDSEAQRSILVIDDEVDFLLYLRRTLEGEGYHVSSAVTATQALREVKRQRFSVVLADLCLPDGSGLSALAEARRVDPLTVGLLVTGHGSMDTALEAMRQGAYDYLVKPCPQDLLLASVRRAHEHHQLRLSLVHKTAQLEKLEALLQDRTQMIQNVSHELKNPLSVVYGYSSFLLKQEPHETKPEELKRSLQSIHNNAERLGHLLEDLLESTRLAGHKVELHRQALPVASILAEAVENIRFEAVKKEIELRCAGPVQDLKVHADPKRVHQILANLLVNALKFTPPGGSVTLSAESDGPAVRFCVRDTGVGIAPEEMDHLFERFYQAERTRRDHPGLGLGLEICKGLVELHGGRIWAESGPGQGSSFLFTLPQHSPRLESRRHSGAGSPA